MSSGLAFRSLAKLRHSHAVPDIVKQVHLRHAKAVRCPVHASSLRFQSTTGRRSAFQEQGLPQRMSSVPREDGGDVTIPPNIPREDYATPAMYSFGIMYRLFRYSIYASVIIVAGGATIYTAIHAYVEYVALAGPNSSAHSEYYSNQDLIPNFSGAHRGGGTDPSIGWRARNAARAAWIALNWSRGGIVSNVRGGTLDYAIPDVAWLEAEHYLLYAIESIDTRSNTTTSESEKVSLKLARQELHFTLAEVRSKLAGRTGLQTARQQYQEVLDGIISNTTNSSFNSARQLEIHRRIAELEVRLLNEVIGTRGSPEQVKKQRRETQERLSDTLLNVMGAGSEDANSPAPIPPQEESTDTVPPSTSTAKWYEVWKKDTPSTPRPSSVLPKITTSGRFEALASAVKNLPTTTTPPPLLRSIVSGIQTLTVSLASSGDIASILPLCQAAASLLEEVKNNPNARSSELLHGAWLKSQEAIFKTYLAEGTAALRLQATKSGSAPTSTVPIDNQPEVLLSESLALADANLLQLDRISKGTYLRPSELRIPLQQTQQTLAKAGSMTAQIKGVLAENNHQSKQALDSYEQCLEFIGTLEKLGRSGAEFGAQRQAVIGSIRRCRETLQKEYEKA